MPSPHCSLRSLVATAKALWYQPHPLSKTVSTSRIEHETWWNMMKHLAVLVLVQSWQDPGAFRGCTTHTLWGGSNSVITPGPRRATCGQPESVSSHSDNLYLYHFFHPFHLLIVHISKKAQQLCNSNRLPDCPLFLQIFTWNGYDMLWQRNNQIAVALNPITLWATPSKSESLPQWKWGDACGDASEHVCMSKQSHKAAQLDVSTSNKNINNFKSNRVQWKKQE